MTFDNRVITFRGILNNTSYDQILRDKEAHIYDLYALSDYYLDADPLYRGIIKQVYVPFSIADPWKLVGSNEETKRKYERLYRDLRLKDKMESIMYQYFKYANVFVYLFNDGRLITLPPDMVRIGSVTVGGEPLLEFDCTKALLNLGVQRRMPSAENYLKDSDIDIRLQGYPPEVAEGVRAGAQWYQLNPHNTFCMQDTKEDWMRYAIPMIASCLLALRKKAIISDWEDSSMKLGTRAFLHVKYGDPDGDVLPNREQLSRVYYTFKRAMQGTALAVTNHWAECEFKQPDLDEIFHYDKYNSVNTQILSAGGISDIMVSGQSSGNSTFATAQVSMQTAAIRIRRARDCFCEMMNRINQRINEKGFGGVSHSAPDQIPQFTFPPVDLAGTRQFQETCTKLYNLGVVAKQTLLEAHGFDINQEVERRINEKAKGFDEILRDPAQVEAGLDGPDGPEENETEPGYGTYTRNGKTYKRKNRGSPASKQTETEPGNEGGRPTLDDNERNSDPYYSETGRAPKPSNPDGSTAMT